MKLAIEIRFKEVQIPVLLLITSVVEATWLLFTELHQILHTAQLGNFVADRSISVAQNGCAGPP